MHAVQIFLQVTLECRWYDLYLNTKETWQERWKVAVQAKVTEISRSCIKRLRWSLTIILGMTNTYIKPFTIEMSQIHVSAAINFQNSGQKTVFCNLSCLRTLYASSITGF